ncbi:MAG: hypothetical protein WKF77_03670 [Planctomycetaceae bacterium]
MNQAGGSRKRHEIKAYTGLQVMILTFEADKVTEYEATVFGSISLPDDTDWAVSPYLRGDEDEDFDEDFGDAEADDDDDDDEFEDEVEDDFEDDDDFDDDDFDDDDDDFEDADDDEEELDEEL